MGQTSTKNTLNSNVAILPILPCLYNGKCHADFVHNQYINKKQPIIWAVKEVFLICEKTCIVVWHCHNYNVTGDCWLELMEFTAR